jgi:hypothetical protein
MKLNFKSALLMVGLFSIMSSSYASKPIENLKHKLEVLKESKAKNEEALKGFRQNGFNEATETMMLEEAHLSDASEAEKKAFLNKKVQSMIMNNEKLISDESSQIKKLQSEINGIANAAMDHAMNEHLNGQGNINDVNQDLNQDLNGQRIHKEDELESKYTNNNTNNNDDDLSEVLAKKYAKKSKAILLKDLEAVRKNSSDPQANEKKLAIIEAIQNLNNDELTNADGYATAKALKSNKDDLTNLVNSMKMENIKNENDSMDAAQAADVKDRRVNKSEINSLDSKNKAQIELERKRSPEKEEDRKYYAEGDPLDAQKIAIKAMQTILDQAGKDSSHMEESAGKMSTLKCKLFDRANPFYKIRYDIMMNSSKKGTTYNDLSVLADNAEGMYTLRVLNSCTPGNLLKTVMPYYYAGNDMIKNGINKFLGRTHSGFMSKLTKNNQARFGTTLNMDASTTNRNIRINELTSQLFDSIKSLKAAINSNTARADDVKSDKNDGIFTRFKKAVKTKVFGTGRNWLKIGNACRNTAFEKHTDLFIKLTALKDIKKIDSEIFPNNYQSICNSILSEANRPNTNINKLNKMRLNRNMKQLNTTYDKSVFSNPDLLPVDPIKEEKYNANGPANMYVNVTKQLNEIVTVINSHPELFKEAFGDAYSKVNAMLMDARVTVKDLSSDDKDATKEVTLSSLLDNGVPFTLSNCHENNACRKGMIEHFLMMNKTPFQIQSDLEIADEQKALLKSSAESNFNTIRMGLTPSQIVKMNNAKKAEAKAQADADKADQDAQEKMNNKMKSELGKIKAAMKKEKKAESQKEIDGNEAAKKRKEYESSENKMNANYRF